MAADSVPPPAPPATGRRPRVRGLILVLSLVVNVSLLLALAAVLIPMWGGGEQALGERHFSGDAAAADKVAIIRIAGVLMDGTNGFAVRQIEQAAKDRAVKAVVVRVESPGGTISASEELHRALVDLRDNTHRRFAGTGKKPLVASMGNIAASGGYYVAMPAAKVVAEPTTITGSIGVFAALPNISKLATDHGISVQLIKAGHIKGGGSPFQELSPDERQPWQDMVDHAYDRFLTVVAEGRPGLTKERLVGEKTVRDVPAYGPKGDPLAGPDGKPTTVVHTRYRADGGSYTPKQARDLGLIDDIADLPAAVTLAAEAAGLTRFRAVSYERPKSVAEVLLGFNLSQSAHPLSSESLAAAITPRLWYLAPGYEGAAAVASPAP